MSPTSYHVQSLIHTDVNINDNFYMGVSPYYLHCNAFSSQYSKWKKKHGMRNDEMTLIGGLFYPSI